MANMMKKVGDKLHMGGHKKDEPQPYGSAQTAAPGYGTSATHPTHTGLHTHAPITPVAAPADHHQGPMQNIKNKVKGGKGKMKAKVHGEDGSSSSSSESDGAGGRRKKKLGML